MDFNQTCVSNSPMYALPVNNFQPKASTWMCLTSTAIMEHNKGNFEKVPGHNNFHQTFIHQYGFLYMKFFANHLFVVYAMRIINQQCRITFVYIHKKQWYAKQKHPGCKKVRGQEAAL